MISTVKYNQNIFDACIDKYGSIAYVAQFIKENSLKYDSLIVQGQELITQEKGNENVKDFYSRNKIVPARGQYIPPPPPPPSLSFWVVGSTSFDPVIVASEIAEFDFGDGTSETTTNSPTHVYADTEDYLVKIYLSDLGLITRLNLVGDKLKGMLDVSLLTNLDVLYCYNNQLTDLSSNVNLTRLICHSNQLTELSSNINLTRLTCHSNQLTELDLSSSINLTYLEAQTNKLTELDLSSNVNLTYLECSSNKLTPPDLSNNVNLRTLKCSSNQLTELDLSQLTNLTQLLCYTNQISILDLQSPKLNYIDFRSNNMTSAQVDQVWINLDNSTTQIDGYADGGGTNDAPTSASQTARDNLTANGWTLIL